PAARERARVGAPAPPGLGVLAPRGPRGPRAQAGVDHAASRPSTSEQLLPPKPNELLSTGPAATRAPRPARVTAGGSGSRSPSKTWGIRGIGPSRPSRSASQQKAASIAPAAPSVWPTSGLDELVGGGSPKTRATAEHSIRSFSGVPVPWRLRDAVSPRGGPPSA